MLPADQLAGREAAAVAAVAALKDAKLVRTTKADWRLVAAAQAIRRCEYADEFDAAAAMGKQISQRREVEHWSEKLEQLEQRAAAAGDGAAGQHTGLLVESAWISKNVPGIQQLNATSLVLSPGKQHGKRTISAISSTPGGSTREMSASVDYTLPPTHGERESVSKRRDDRHRRREERKLRSLDLSGATQHHAASDAARHRAARDNEREVAAVLEDCLQQVWSQAVMHKPMQLPPPSDECWKSPLARFPGEAVWMDTLISDPPGTPPDRLVWVNQIYENMTCDVTLMDVSLLQFGWPRVTQVHITKLRPIRGHGVSYQWHWPRVAGPTPWSRPGKTDEESRIQALLDQLSSQNGDFRKWFDVVRRISRCNFSWNIGGHRCFSAYYVGPCTCGLWPPLPLRPPDVYCPHYYSWDCPGCDKPGHGGSNPVIVGYPSCRNHRSCRHRICHR